MTPKDGVSKKTKIVVRVYNDSHLQHVVYLTHACKCETYGSSSLANTYKSLPSPYCSSSANIDFQFVGACDIAV